MIIIIIVIARNKTICVVYNKFIFSIRKNIFFKLNFYVQSFKTEMYFYEKMSIIANVIAYKSNSFY